MFTQLVYYYKKNLRLFLSIMSICLIIIICQILIPVGTREIINTYLPKGNIRGIIIISLLLIIVTFIYSIANYIKIFYGHILGANIEKEMRIKMFEHFQTLDFEFFDKYKTGQILSRLTTDLNYISEFAHHGAEEAFTTIIIVIVGIFYLSSINLLLTVIFYILIIIHFALLYRNRNIMKKSMRAVRDELGEVNAKTESSLSAIRLTRAYTNEEMEIEEYINRNEHYRKKWKNAYKHLAIFMSFNGFCLQIQTILLIGIGTIFIVYGELTFGDLMAFFLFFQILIGAVSRIMNMLESFQQGITSFDRYIEIMNVKPKIIEADSPINSFEVEGNVTFSNVNFEYVSDKPVIKNLSFDVKRGNMIALVGESGIGKSTIIQLIPRFYEVTSGSILIDGHNIKDMSFENLRNAIGYVQQDVVLFYGTIKDNILYGKPNATDEEIDEAIDKAKLREFVNSLEEGIYTQVGEKGIILSGGQKQRISLARIFLKNPPILLLDEATSALDTITERYIQEQIASLSIGRTVIVVAHRLSTIKEANHILVLNKNGVAEEGTHDELFSKKGYYYELYNSSKSEFY